MVSMGQDRFNFAINISSETELFKYTTFYSAYHFNVFCHASLSTSIPALTFSPSITVKFSCGVTTPTSANTFPFNLLTFSGATATSNLLRDSKNNIVSVHFIFSTGLLSALISFHKKAFSDNENEKKVFIS